MDDPCRQCDKLEKRDEYLKIYYLRFPNLRKDQPAAQAPKEFHECEEKYKRLIDIVPDALFIADIETGIILEANQQAAVLLGIPVEKIIGMEQWQLHPREEIQRYKRLFRQHAREGEIHLDENVYVTHCDGRKIPVQINASVVHLDGKQVVCGIFRDISEPQKLQQQLIQSEEQYRQLYDHALVALYRTRISDGKVLACNDALATMGGYDSKKEVLNEAYAPSFYANKSRREELLKCLRKQGTVKDFEIEFVRRDGSHGWVAITAKIYPEQGYIEGAQIDITPTKVLTETEKKILDIILRGKSNKEIAKILNRSVRTVEDHRAHIMHKLNAHNLIELVQKTQTFQFELDRQLKI